MGHGSYSDSSRKLRAASSGYYSKSRDEIFTQSKERRIHDEMNPYNVKVRVASDSESHPNTVPIQLYLDVTGSMGEIPHLMIKDGLPTLMGTLTQNGVPDATLMFGAVGDHECDRGPLQVGQFEAGDAELDMWLERTWIEGGGGGNSGESYPLAWYFAANHTQIDSFDLRKKKGFIFTVGDEPFLKNVPVSALKSIMGDSAVGEGNYTAEQLLTDAQKKNHVFHIFIEHGSRSCDNAWKQLLGRNLIITNDHREIPKLMSMAIINTLAGEGSIVSNPEVSAVEPSTTNAETSGTAPEILL